MNVLKQVFLDYAETSGQIVNPQKSSIFAGSISNHRLNHIANQIDFTMVLYLLLILEFQFSKASQNMLIFNLLLIKSN